MKELRFTIGVADDILPLWRITILRNVTGRFARYSTLQIKILFLNVYLSKVKHFTTQKDANE